MVLSSDATVVEIELTRKLLERGHLNVPEHAILGGRVRFSVLLGLLDASLDEHPFFPPSRTIHDYFTGILIERRGEEYWVHERHEMSAYSLSPVSSRRVESSSAALLAKVQEEGFPGVSVDLKA